MTGGKKGRRERGLKRGKRICMNYNIIGWIIAEYPVVLFWAELQGAWVDGGGREVSSLPALSLIIGVVDTGFRVTGEDKLNGEMGEREGEMRREGRGRENGGRGEEEGGRTSNGTL